MSDRCENLGKFGWDSWFETVALRRSEPEDRVARVVAVDREQCLLIDETGTFRARLAGSYVYRHPLSQDRPCVGDWVCAEKGESEFPRPF